MFVLLWVTAVIALIGLTYADTRLAKTIGVEPPAPLWLIYAGGAWLIGTIWLDILGAENAKK